MDALLSQENIRVWILAIRPKSLAAAMAPVIVGSFITEVPLSNIDWVVFICALCASICITIATNLINDAYDFKKGADTEKRIGPIRVTQSGLLTFKEVLVGGFSFLCLAALFSIPLFIKGGVLFIFAFLVAALSSYLYTAGPFPLAYVGLGEVFVMIFYGLLATYFSAYLQTNTFSWENVIPALQVGSLATVMIAINNLRDIYQDVKAEKKTLAVRFGIFFGKIEIAFFLFLPFFLNIYWFIQEKWVLFLLPFLSMGIAINIFSKIWKLPPSKKYNSFFGKASLLLILFSLSLVIGSRL